MGLCVDGHRSIHGAWKALIISTGGVSASYWLLVHCDGVVKVTEARSTSVTGLSHTSWRASCPVNEGEKGSQRVALSPGWDLGLCEWRKGVKYQQAFID